MNLKKEYNDFINKCANQIKQLDIDNNLTKEKCIDIYKLYLAIYTSIKNSQSLNINDVNHIILNYGKENKDVELFRKFIKIKNLFLIRKIVRSSLWEPFILKLKGDIDLKDCDNLRIATGVYKLLKSYVYHFSGCWEIAEFKDDKIKKIEIIEPEHIEFLLNYLEIKI